jgi:hypothetical protein
MNPKQAIATTGPVDHALLLRARLTVARAGETGMFGWWAANDLLNEMGAWVARRVLPVTHYTAQARIAFAVARHACDLRVPDPTTVHLFRLDPFVEDRFDAFLASHLNDDEMWKEIMGPVETMALDADLASLFVHFGMATAQEVAAVGKLPLGPAGRSLPLPSPQDLPHGLRLLATGFIRSAKGNLVVPVLPKGQLT